MQPNYPPRGFGGQAPPQQQQQQAPRSGGGFAPPNAGYGNTPFNQQQQPMSQPSGGNFPGRGFPGAQQPQAPHSSSGGRPGLPGQAGPPAPGSQGSFRPGQQVGPPQGLLGPAPGHGGFPGQAPPAPGGFNNAPPAAGPPSFQSGPQGPPRQQFQQGPPPPGQQFGNAPPPQGGRPGPPQFGGQQQGPPPPQFNGQQQAPPPPQGGAAPYLQPNRNAGPYPGPPGPGAGAPPYGAPGAPGGYGQPQPGYPGPQQQQQLASQAPKQRIDPTQIPRPVVSAERTQYVARGHTVTMPPAASSDYVCVDEGCCNPRFIRPTLNHVPATKELLKQCGLPLAAVICPLADLQEDELPIPLVDFGPSGPLRCTRCAAYVNSFTKFIQGGRKFVCNICQLHNETPRDYYCSVDQYGKRRDIQERAELSRGSVEYVVPAAYTIRPPQEPILVFVLDVSLFSFQTGLATSALQTIQYLLPSMAQNKRKKVGIVTFDTAVHYYRMDNGSSSISMSICPDIDDPVAPLPPSSWLVSMDDPAAAEKITELSDVITRSFENTTKNQAVSGAALWSVADALSVSGGRVVLLHAGAPRVGVGRVKREEVSGAYGTTKEVDLYTPEENNAYEALARQCAENHISVDVFSVANTFASLADLGRVCELTGGRVQYMPQFEKEQSSNRHHLTSMLQRLVDRDCGYEAVLKVRCSAGLRVEHSYGNFFNARGGNAFTTDEMEFAVIDQDRSMCVTFAYDEPLAEGTDAYIQAALLYTRSDGLRCVRVHNLALQVEPLLSNVFRFADLDATCSVWQRSAARQFVDKQLMRATPMAVKESLVDQCVTVLFNYRKYCASSSSSGQLILPESLKLLPLYTLATLKSRALRGNLVGNPPRGFIDVRADERVMMMGLLNSLPVEFCVSAVYPKLYSVHDLADDCCTLDEDGKFVLPPQLPPTAEKLDEEGIFLLHSAMCCYIYIGPKASPELLLELFGVDHADTAEQTLNLFETLDNEPPEGDGDGMSARERLRSLVEYLNSTIPISQPLEILSKNDWRANRFMSALVEDRTRNDVSYVEFLVQVHKKIQYKFH
ncbi:Protein transport protein Sec24-like [Phytophthora rubi]|uniref:Protein transport protein Sec24-like n=1 Tax=Phytophthora rubi TaxID=129364 RepID=A0A6A4FRW0_9STRA|nr:Protein transport protein Sec24-like [Phytophthora rubi]KAE9351581.1 Protein transport protein Sec24-like [Phytophthora rubi]